MSRTIMLAFLSLALIGSVIRMPDAAFQASLQGLTIWWNIVFPGLLPFLVLYELLCAFGLVHGFGVLLRTPMRKLFKLPGESAMPLLFGWSAGFSAGADATATLRKQHKITVGEGQRLLALSHVPNPMFMIIVIGAGFLHRPELGVLITAAVWLSALWTSFLLTAFRKRSKKDDKSTQEGLSSDNPSLGLFADTAAAILAAREQDGRSFGKALGDAVYNSVQKLMAIGGFMIFAAVIARLAQSLFQLAAGNGTLDVALPALLESHIGAYAAAVWQGNSGLLPLPGAAVNVALIAAALAWSGVSAILQAGYSIAGTGLKLLPFIGARVLHAAHAALFALLLWKPAMAALSALVHAAGEKTEAAMLSHGDRFISPISFAAGDLPAMWPYALISASLLAAVSSAIMLLAKLVPHRNRL
ncbi:nucleoside recognition domain-containing protein [Paenibacillus sp. NEAU-GSW1]|uniref:nucleoside recognition domain-containing protein n=1 Tax=Paenibacillus sp. NEAU-GSW1 TaxID=2682486 RepID=UPI0012E221A4|nr:nucleoside recognition domain-containing protein [Paenibacillus sp. NEAU-GSW1]MUT66308.1 nucleoside recognition domain-containing protein [Paenibacillus sp. NEAU-GSW1]